MKKVFLTTMVLALAVLSVQAQGPNPNSAKNLPMVKPSHVWPMPTDAQLTAWNQLNEKAKKNDGELMTEADWQRMEEIENDNAVLEDLYSGHCSWYCGGEVQRVTASSHLKAQGRFNYLPKNAHDFTFDAVWAEGAEGQGIGEWLEYEFAGACPRVTAVKILPGHVKTKAAWEANSRPKYIQVYYLGKPICILDLQDVRAMQYFDLEKFGPFGYHDSDKPTWRLRFEILDVYPGTKYQDTVISELEFDGIDVH
ncbi:MAG: hypothetical protein IKP41_05030 [Bacteroidaceae bacterium]|nr:hypothetical protein [Bacteroidaceae bacterium]